MNLLKCKTLFFITIFGLFCFPLIPIVHAETAIKCTGVESISGFIDGEIDYSEEREITVLWFIDDNNQKLYGEDHTEFTDNCETWSEKLIKCKKTSDLNISNIVTGTGNNSIYINRVTGKYEATASMNMFKGGGGKYRIVREVITDCEEIDPKPKF